MSNHADGQVVRVLGGTTFDVLAAGLPSLPAPGDDEFTASSLAVCPRAPTPSMGGNAGNLAVALSHLEESVELTSAWGDDVFGSWLETMLGEHGVACVRVPPRSTSVNLVMTDRAGERLSAFYPVELEERALLRLVDDVGWRPGDHVVIAGFPHPSVQAMRAWARRAQEVQAAVTLDIGPAIAGLTERHLSGLLPDVDLLLANEEELRVCTGDDSPDEAAHYLAVTYGLAVVVKRGRAGSSCVTGDLEVSVGSLPVPDDVATVGAGDVFNAGFLHASAAGAAPGDALRYGTAAVALMLRAREGVLASPARAQVDQVLREQDATLASPLSS